MNSEILHKGTLKRKILVVDQDPGILDVLCSLLRREGYVATAAQGSSGAEKVLRLRSYDVLIMDIQLLGPSIADFLRMARMLDPLMAIIVLTGRTTIKSAVDAMKEGAYSYITKPIDSRELLMEISQALKYNNERSLAIPKPRVFISYSHADKRSVQNLSDTLRNHGISVWMDEFELKPGDSLIDKLRTAIDQVDVLIAMLSPASVKSKWVQKEIEIAMTQEINGRRMRVIPVLKSRCELPGFLLGKVYLDLTTTYLRRKNLSRLIDAVRCHCTMQFSEESQVGSRDPEKA